MATLVNIDDETKSKLEELQAEIRLKMGGEVAQQEILALIVDQAVESKDDLTESFRETVTRPDAADRTVFHDGMIASGTRTTEEDIDEALYGEYDPLDHV